MTAHSVIPNRLRRYAPDVAVMAPVIAVGNAEVAGTVTALLPVDDVDEVGVTGEEAGAELVAGGFDAAGSELAGGRLDLGLVEVVDVGAVCWGVCCACGSGRTRKYRTSVTANKADRTTVDVRAVTRACHHVRALISGPVRPDRRPRRSLRH